MKENKKKIAHKLTYNYCRSSLQFRAKNQVFYKCQKHLLYQARNQILNESYEPDELPDCSIPRYLVLNQGKLPRHNYY